MAQHRDLEPRTVYLPLDAIKELDRRAGSKAVAVGTLLRQIVLGHEPPLRPKRRR